MHPFHDPELEKMAAIAADLDATMMPFTSVLEQAVLGREFGLVAYTPPATHYIGLLTAATWQASTAYAVGAYVVPTTFGSLTGSVGRVFKATAVSGTGTSAGSQPTWPTTAGGTVVDNPGGNQITWTEVSNLFAANTFTAIEPAAGAYARVSWTNNTSNWGSATGSDPASVTTLLTATFPTTTASWGQLVGAGLWDAATAGTLRAWGLFSATSAVASVSGVTPNIPAGSLTLGLT
jgi:hypothetical protein